MRATSAQSRLGKWRRTMTQLALLALICTTVPDASRPEAEFALVELDAVHGLDATDDVIWMLALGSDARPGEPVLRSRSDAIQLVGLNPVNSHAVTIGIRGTLMSTSPALGSTRSMPRWRTAARKPPLTPSRG